MENILHHIESRSTPEPNTGCSLWLGSFDKDGYARVAVEGQSRPVTRVLLGLLGTKLHALHTCDNAWCVAREHLYAGTHRDNMRDAIRRGRSGIKGHPGEENPGAKLTADDVRSVRAWLAQGERARDVAVAFGVAKGTVLAIQRRAAWKHVH